MFLWIKAFHIIAVICWFAALFYLPRLFVYHAMTEDTAGKERFKVMERKLYRGIAIPSMIATLILGFWTAGYNWDYYISSTWFIIKLLVVALIIGYHHACGSLLKKFAKDANTRSHNFYRWFNEAPIIALIVIVLLVVLKQPI